MAGTDGNAGYFSPVNPGVVRTFELIFSDALQAFDAIASITSTSVSVSPTPAASRAGRLSRQVSIFGAVTWTRASTR
jgi:hypothetical protein